MAVAGSLTYDTNIDKTGFNQGLNSITNSVKSGGTKIKNIIAALGITKIISTAMNTIMNSIDGAVSRIDTLNNFPKVMSNLGIASEDSSKAINKLSDGLQGIPTKLDDAALSVQRFTSKNGDVDKSVDLFLAVNNALLAGGASAEIQTSAMEQLSQSYAKGKPDMVEWRAIQTAMPAQLKQISQEILGNKDSLDIFLKKAQEYADANPLSASGSELVEQLKAVKAGTGDMTTALGTALRLGIISMDDFMNTIVKLNKEGSGEFLSFEEQAKNATGGIQTSITNAKTAITRGVANIVKAIDEMLKNNGLGGISTVVNNIGKTAEKVLNKIATSLIPKVVDKIKDICKWVQENQDIVKKLITVIASLTAGYIAYKAVLIAINAIQTVKNIVGTVSAFLSLIPAIKSAKDAMLLFNTVSSANPIGLLVAGVVALTAAFIAFSAAQTEEQKQAKQFAESMASAKTAMEEYNASVDKTTNQELAHMNNISSLRKELSQLVNENGEVKKGYESRVNFILNELNSALGTEYKLNGNVIESYKELQNEIDETIEKKRAEIILKGKEDKYKNAVQEEAEAVENLKTAHDNLGMSLKEAQNKYDELIKKKEEYEKSGDINNGDYLNTGKEAQRLDDLINAYKDAESTVKTCTENKKDYEENYALFLEGKYSEISNTVKTSTQNWTNSSLGTIRSSIIEQQNALNTYKQIYQQTGNEVALQQQEQAKQNLSNLANELIARTSTIGTLGVEEIAAWKTLGNTSYEEYKTALSKMSPELQNEIQMLTGIMINDQSMSSSTEYKAEQMTNSFKEKLKLSGMTDEEIESITSKLRNDTTVEGGAKDLADSANTGFNNNVDGNKWGTDLSSNISSGMTSQTSKNWIVGAATSVAGWIKNIIGHSVPKAGPLKDELTYMPDMINNLVKGIEKNRYKVINATNRIAEDIKDGFDLEELNNNIVNKMNRAVALETGSINATASVKSNNSMLNVINLTAKIDGSVDMNNQQVGRLVAPEVCKTIKAGGLA